MGKSWQIHEVLGSCQGEGRSSKVLLGLCWKGGIFGYYVVIPVYVHGCQCIYVLDVNYNGDILYKSA